MTTMSKNSDVSSNESELILPKTIITTTTTNSNSPLQIPNSNSNLNLNSNSNSNSNPKNLKTITTTTIIINNNNKNNKNNKNNNNNNNNSDEEEDSDDDNNDDDDDDDDDDSDDQSEEDNQPLLSLPTRPTTPASSLSGSSKKNRKRHRFVEDDSDEESEEDSSDDYTIEAAKRTRAPPKKRRKVVDKNGMTSATNGSREKKSKETPEKERRSSSSSSSIKKNKVGYINREVFDPDLFQVKKEIKALSPDKNAIQWWDRLEDLWNDEIKWNTLDHNGVVFAAPYEPHKVKMLYEGKEVDLTPNQEEVATMFGVMSGTDWANKTRFRNNFFKEFRKILCDKREIRTHEYITDLNKCNFDRILEWYQKRREQEKEMKKDSEYKAKMKIMKAEMDSKYGWAVVDGVLEKVGNYKVEPPGLFRGRGEHPKMGLIKKRLQPEDVILNIAKGMAIPPCPIPGHKWGGVIHDQSVTYIAKWVENINGQHKFVYLHSSSRFKGVADVKKYEKARQLKKHVAKIRHDYESKLNSSKREVKQLATAVWIIDHLSIRVGNEKDTDEEADTVGVCSLRCEHIQFDPNESQITFDFLGKDSMRYCQTIKIPQIIYNNLKEFTQNKKADVDILEKIDSSVVNNYLKDQMDGLTAKVFRTHNASVCLEKELAKNEHSSVGSISKDSPLENKLFFYTQCNKQVAILCNHQRTVPKSHEQQLEKIDNQIQELKENIKELKKELDIAEGRKSSKKNAKTKIRQPDQLRRMIEKKQKQLRKKELSKEMKSENKEIALGTSKINYMDPRITVAWCKRMEVPIEKIFNKSLLDKFPWAMSVPPSFEF